MGCSTNQQQTAGDAATNVSCKDAIAAYLQQAQTSTEGEVVTK